MTADASTSPSWSNGADGGDTRGAADLQIEILQPTIVVPGNIPFNYAALGCYSAKWSDQEVHVHCVQVYYSEE